MISFIQMRCFYEAAMASSFSAAAEKLFITQQAMSIQIARVEKEIGVELFVRSRPLRLTAAGEVFFRGVQTILHTYDQTGRELRDIIDNGEIVVRIGITHAYARAVLPLVLKQAYEQYPELNVQVYEMPFEQMMDALSKNKVDMIITKDFFQAEGIRRILLGRDVLCLYAPELSLLKSFGEETGALQQALQKYTDLKLVEQCPFILPRAGTVRINMTEILQKMQITPRIRIETEALETAIYLCRNGLGITVAPRILLNTYAGGVNADSCYPLPESEPLAQHEIVLGYIEKNYMTKSMKKLIDCTKQVMAEVL